MSPAQSLVLLKLSADEYCCRLISSSSLPVDDKIQVLLDSEILDFGSSVRKAWSMKGLPEPDTFTVELAKAEFNRVLEYARKTVEDLKAAFNGFGVPRAGEGAVAWHVGKAFEKCSRDAKIAVALHFEGNWNSLGRILCECVAVADLPSFMNMLRHEQFLEPEANDEEQEEYRPWNMRWFLEHMEAARMVPYFCCDKLWPVDCNIRADQLFSFNGSSEFGTMLDVLLGGGPYEFNYERVCKFILAQRQRRDEYDELALAIGRTLLECLTKEGRETAIEHLRKIIALIAGESRALLMVAHAP